MSTHAGQIDYRALLQRAYATLEDMQARLARAEKIQREPIAVVGMGFRFPGGARDAASFWKLLSEGMDVVTEVPPERWDVDAYYDPDPDAPGKSYTRWGAFLEEIDRFDARFFGISPREAASMDPQQRLLLEASWEALENAGYASPQMAGSRTGVFAGMIGVDYGSLPGQGPVQFEMDAYFGTGVSRSIAAGRISYALGLHGPSLAVDTACSSSAVATHLACLSLRARDCDMALAGGVNLMLVPEGSISASRARMMSFTGRCKAFDAAADGYVRAEGCAMVMLKRLSDAVADRDNILGVILGTVVNQDGRSNGITAPNGRAQEMLLRAALADAGLGPAEISYIEAHGTGTSLGDPIEIRALASVFAEAHTKEEPLMIGSVKTNIGHTEGIAGTAGLIKLLLAMQHRTIPPHLHLHEPNPHIPWDTLPVSIPTAPTPWRVAEGKRRIAGVSSFGFSGTNSHIILAEPPVVVEQSRPTPDAPRRAHLLAISGRSTPALEELAESYTRYLDEEPGVRLADLTFTANTGRTHFRERLAVVADSAGEIGEKLAAWRAGEAPDGVLCGTAASGAAPEVAFLFTGQGSQYVGMGRQLYESEGVFRTAVDRCDELLRPHLERPLLSVLYPAPGDEEEAERLVHQTAYTQPALFAVEYALAQLWRSWGIEPALVMGHSVGEYVAACVAGVFSLEDGLRLIAARGRLMQALPAGGEMAAIFADEASVAAAIEPHAAQLSIAAINGPRNVVVSGDGGALRDLLAQLVEQGIKAKPITVSHAFHSPLMEPMLDQFARVAATVAFAPPRIGLVSNVSGRVAGEEIASAAYWRDHVRATVRFADAVRVLDAEGCTAFLEIGPAPTLVGLAQRCLPEADRLWLPSLRQSRQDEQQMLASLGALYVHGAEINWRGVEREEGQRRIPLPTYPFQRQRYWINLPKLKLAADRPRLHPLLDERVRSPLIAGTVFQSRVSLESPTYLNDHRIFDAPLFPATGFVEMVWRAAQEAFGTLQGLAAVQIRDALALPESGEAVLQIAISAPEEEWASFQVFSLQEQQGAGEEWKLHVAGRIRTGGAAATPADAATLDEVRARCTDEFPVAPFYERLAELGVGYGPAFRGLREVWRRDGEALARIELPEELRREAGEYQLHPALLDACIQLLGAAVPGADDPDAAEDVYIPLELGSYRLHHPGRSAVWCQTVLDRGEGDVLAGELRLFDADGMLIAEVGGVHLKRVTRAAIERVLGAALTERRLYEWLHALDWEPAGEAPPRADWAPGRWLLFADAGGVAEALASRLAAEGGVCTVVRPADLDSLDAASFARFFEAASGNGHGSLRGVVHLWSLDEVADPTAAAIQEHQRRVCGSTLALVQAMVAARPSGAGLWLVTRGAQALAGDAEPVSPAQAPLWGLANTITAEHPELACVCLDLDAQAGFDAAAAIAVELAAGDREDRVALRFRGRHVARIVRYPTDRGDTGTLQAEAVELEITERGILDNLSLRPTTRTPPGSGEVEIEVRASGLNFRDVLNALGMYPGDAGALGSECAGVVTAVGEDVANIAVGDEVIAMAGGTFRSHLLARAESVYPKPEPLSFAEAAGIPIAFLTAYYGLHTLAGLRPGDRVLIHSAAGGVGLAAVQLAQLAGAEVFGTAGSPEKREFLRSLGVQHVMSSRTLDFADEIMELTGGEGVEIVLNALTDDFIPKSFSVLADHGCFLEIGKRGVWTPAQVAELNPTWRYHLYDLSEALGPGSDFFRTAMDWLVERFESGALRPLPLQSFPLAEAPDAFRFMAQAKHTGKIVIVQEGRDAPAAGATVRADATYLITGGLGGLGLAVARGLVERGARSLVLMGRSAPSEAARQAIAELEGTGAHIHPFAGDVGSEADVKRLLAQIGELMPPLRGVIHAAGVIDDGVLLQQSWPRFETVLRPKLLGSWHLHSHARDLPLDFFILFSTGSALLGSAGQGNYSAANAFLDGLAHHRRALGLPATSINWGAWSEVGMAAGLGKRDRERWREHGLGMISPADGVQLLDRILREAPAQVAVLPFDWARFLRQQAAGGTRPILERMAAASEARKPSASAPAAEPDLLRQLQAAEPEKRYDLLRAYVQDRVRHVLALDSSVALDPRHGLSDLGMDSLMAVELSNHLQNGLGTKLPSTIAFEYPTLVALTDHLAAEVLSLVPAGEETADGKADAVKAQEEARLAAVAQLSDDEAEDTLLKELERAGY